MDSAVEFLAARGLAFPLQATACERFAERFNALPAMAHMGAQLDLSTPPLVQVHLPRIEDHHRGGMGTEAVNGAVLSGLADCALGVAGVLQFNGESAGTVDMSIKFLRPALGDSLVACAVALKRSDRLVFAEAEIYASGKLCALATGVTSQPARRSGESF